MRGATDPDGDEQGDEKFCGIDRPSPRALMNSSFGGRADHGACIGVGGADGKKSDPRSDDVAPEMNTGKPKCATDQAVRKNRRNAGEDDQPPSISGGHMVQGLKFPATSEAVFHPPSQ